MLLVFCWSRIWIVAQFDLDQFKPLLRQFKAFERFSPVPLEQFLTYAGSIAMQYNEPVLILCVVVWAISRGSDVVSGELGRGTMEMLLAQPISRTRLLLCHGGVSTVGLGLLCVAVFLGTHFGIATNSVTETIQPTIQIKVPFLPAQIPLPTGEAEEIDVSLADRVDSGLFVAPTMNLFGFGFFLLGLSSMVSCWDRYRWRTIGIVLSTYVVQFLVFVLSRSTETTGWCGYLTFFSLYQPDAIVQLVRNEPSSTFAILNQFDVPGWPHVLAPFGMSCVFVLMGLVCYFFGWIGFRRRDLPAPL